jgi:hypothetical protein
VNERQLIDRLEQLGREDEHPDWADVVRRASVSDRVASAEKVRRRRLRLIRGRALVLVVVVALVGAGVALLPGGRGRESDGGLLQNALAAVSGGPVLHVVLEWPLSDGTATQNGSQSVFAVIDLSTGRSRAVMNRQELWYDPARGLTHAVDSLDGTVIADELVRGRTAVFEDPTGRIRTTTLRRSAKSSSFFQGLDAFLLGYKHALATGSATREGSGTFDGHRVEWLRFTSPHPPAGASGIGEVAVDQRTYTAVAIRDVCPSCTTPPVAIKTIEGISTTAADFTPPSAHPQIRVAQYGDGKRQERQGNLTTASMYLGHETFWAGPTVGRSRFSGTRFARPVQYSSDALNPGPGSVIARGRGVTFYYGTTSGPEFNAKPGQAYISIAETTDVGFSFYGFNMQTLGLAGQPLTAAGTAVPPEGELVLSYTGPGGGWTGQMRKGRMDIEIEAPSRELVIRAAQALVPTPRSTTR